MKRRHSEHPISMNPSSLGSAGLSKTFQKVPEAKAIIYNNKEDMNLQQSRVSLPFPQTEDRRHVEEPLPFSSVKDRQHVKQPLPFHSSKISSTRPLSADAFQNPREMRQVNSHCKGVTVSASGSPDKAEERLFSNEVRREQFHIQKKEIVKRICKLCDKGAQFLCSRCRDAWYCSEECQVIFLWN